MTFNGVKNYLEQIGAWPENTGNLAGKYAVGYLLSLAFTIVAFWLVMMHALSQSALFGVVVALALMQFAVQIALFLHLSVRRGDRERLLVFISFIVIVFILVGGSLWVMTNLNGRMMPTPDQMRQYMQAQDIM